MNPERKTTIIKYCVSFAVASLISFLVFWYKGFFDHSLAVNLQILSDGFYTAGIIFLSLAGLMFISGEGALIGIGFVCNSILQFFLPMGRKYHESFADYRARKIGKVKKLGEYHLLVTGLVFFIAAVTITIIWSQKFYK